MIKILITFIIFFTSICSFAQDVFDDNYDYEQAFWQLLDSRDYGLAINLLDQHQSDTLSPADVSLFKAIAYDKMNEKEMAIISLENFFQTYQLYSNSENSYMLALELYWRLSYDNFSIDSLQYTPNKQQLNDFKNKSWQSYIRIKHHLFLHYILQDDYKNALDLFVVNSSLGRATLEDSFYFLLKRKLVFINDISFFEKIIDLTLESDQNIEIVLSAVELLIKEKKYDYARKLIYSITTESSKDVSNYNKYIQVLSVAIERMENDLPFKVGVIFPIGNSRFSNISEYIINGLYYGIERWDLLSRDIELIFQDPGNDYDGAKKAYQHLVEKQQVQLVLGPITVLTSESLVDIANTYRVPFISFSVSVDNNKLPAAGYVLRKNTKSEAQQIAKYSAQQLCRKNAVILYDKNSTIQRDIFKNIFTAYGGNILGSFKLDNYSYELVATFNEFTGKSVYQGGGSLYDATSDATPAVVDVIYSSLPNEANRLLLNFINVFNLQGVALVGGNNFKDSLFFTQKDFIGEIYYSDSVSDTTSIDKLYNQIWISAGNKNGYNIDNSYPFYGYFGAFLLSQIYSRGTLPTLKDIRQALMASDYPENDVGNLLRIDNEFFVSPSVITLYKKDASSITEDFLEYLGEENIPQQKFDCFVEQQ